MSLARTQGPPKPGEFAPWFVAVNHANPRFNFSTLASRYVLLGFLPDDAAERDLALAKFQAHRALFDDERLTCFMVVRDAEGFASTRDEPPGKRWFLDPDGAISRLYGALGENGVAAPQWVLIDPSLRILATAPTAQADALFASLAGLGRPDEYAGVELSAPVLIVPRILEPQLCQRLVAYYEAAGGQASGVMREIDGRTVGVLDDFKRRKDATIEDEALRRELSGRIEQRLWPEILKAYQFRATRIERYIVACYDAQDGGYFRPHRDNETRGTAHRRYAVSINLNAEAFEGGDLRFPEFGRRTYRPPTGGAVVFCASIQHEATPVVRGRRYAFLPFLYDEEGARIRAENLEHLATNHP
jgi:predicted 2-oxoglutarate/Fe(II)-dependent dioxygenase YbiX/peroxiredoxin